MMNLIMYKLYVWYIIWILLYLIFTYYPFFKFTCYSKVRTKGIWGLVFIELQNIMILLVLK